MSQKRKRLPVKTTRSLSKCWKSLGKLSQKQAKWYDWGETQGDINAFAGRTGYKSSAILFSLVAGGNLTDFKELSPSAWKRRETETSC